MEPGELHRYRVVCHWHRNLGVAGAVFLGIDRAARAGAQCLFHSDFPRTRLRRILRVATTRAKHQHAETSSHRRGDRSLRGANRRNRGLWREWRAAVEAEKATGRWQKSCATTSPVASSD